MMTVMTTLPWGRELTRDDLDALPDDGHRHELLDGVLVMSPAPSLRHQVVTANLYSALRASCPDDLLVLFAPFDVVLARNTVLEPDLLVARRSDFSDRDLPGPPLLAVEVLSPSTRRFDLLLKKDRFQVAGCPSNWVVDPDVPEIVAWELWDGTYAEVARARGADNFRVIAPYAVELSPRDLVD